MAGGGFSKWQWEHVMKRAPHPSFALQWINLPQVQDAVQDQVGSAAVFSLFFCCSSLLILVPSLFREGEDNAVCCTPARL